MSAYFSLIPMLAANSLSARASTKLFTIFSFSSTSLSEVLEEAPKRGALDKATILCQRFLKGQQPLGAALPKLASLPLGKLLNGLRLGVRTPMA